MEVNAHHPAFFVEGDALHLQCLVYYVPYYGYVMFLSQLSHPVLFCLQDPFTHIYMFDRGFPESEGKPEHNMYLAVGKAFNNSNSATYLIACATPTLILTYFKVNLVSEFQLNAKMKGSRTQISMRLYCRIATTQQSDIVTLKPDPIFADACHFALSSLANLKCEINKRVNEWQTVATTETRSKRIKNI